MGEVGGLVSPQPLADYHEVEGFRCGEDSLDNWLLRKARANQLCGASRTYVACDPWIAPGRGVVLGERYSRTPRAARRMPPRFRTDAIGIRGIVVHAISQ